MPAAWTTKQATSTRNGRFAAATRSWARSDCSLSTTAPGRRRRACRKKTLTVPTTMMSGDEDAHRPVPGDAAAERASTTIGATAPETRMVRARTATRQVIRRVRSPYGSVSSAPSVISAGIATYGHLEERERGRRGQERDADLDGGGGAGEHAGENRREQHGQRETADQQVRPAGAPAGPGAVGEPAGDRVDQDVPGLRARARAGRPPRRPRPACRSGTAAGAARAPCRRRR